MFISFPMLDEFVISRKSLCGRRRPGSIYCYRLFIKILSKNKKSPATTKHRRTHTLRWTIKMVIECLQHAQICSLREWDCWMRPITSVEWSLLVEWCALYPIDLYLSIDILHFVKSPWINALLEVQTWWIKKSSTVSVCPRKSLQAQKSPYTTDANGLTQLKTDHGYGQRVFTACSNGVLGGTESTEWDCKLRLNQVRYSISKSVPHLKRIVNTFHVPCLFRYEFHRNLY